MFNKFTIFNFYFCKFFVVIGIFICQPIYADNNESGFELAWRIKIAEGSKSNTVQAPVKILNATVLTVTLEGELLALNIIDGSERWRVKLGDVVGRRGFTLSSDGKSIFIFADKFLYEVDSSTGKSLTRMRTGKSVVAPVIVNDHIYFASPKGEVFGIDWSTKKIIWSIDLGSTARVWSPLNFSKKHNLLFLATSNPGGLFAENRSPITDFSSSLVAVDVTTGQVRYSFQDVVTDVWDFDVVGQPILVYDHIAKDGRMLDLVIQLTKTGRVIVLEASDGSPILKDQFDTFLVGSSASNGIDISTFQKKYNWPERFSNIILEEDEFRTEDLTNLSILRHAEFELFTPPSVHYDVIIKGLHGGAEWFGGRHYRHKGTDFLSIPYNDYPWILRAKYINTSRIDRMYNSYENLLRGLRKISIFNSESSFEIPRRSATNKTYDNVKNGGHRWSQQSWVFKNDGASQMRSKLEARLNLNNFAPEYFTHCSECHFSNRRGNYQSELAGSGYIPSLVGYTLTEKYKKFNTLKSLQSVHRQKLNLSSNELKAIYQSFDNYDQKLNDSNKLRVKGFWQPLVDDFNIPHSQPPWGGIAFLNLKSGKIEKRLQLGSIKSQKGTTFNGSMIFGGISEISKNYKGVVVGTVSEEAFYIDFAEQKLIETLTLKRSGSVNPTLLQNDDLEGYFITESGGRFFWYKNDGHYLSYYKKRSQAQVVQ